MDLHVTYKRNQESLSSMPVTLSVDISQEVDHVVGVTSIQLLVKKLHLLHIVVNYHWGLVPGIWITKSCHIAISRKLKENITLKIFMNGCKALLSKML